MVGGPGSSELQDCEFLRLGGGGGGVYSKRVKLGCTWPWEWCFIISECAPGLRKWTRIFDLQQAVPHDTSF